MSGLTAGELARVFDRLPPGTPVRVHVPAWTTVDDRGRLMEVGMTDKVGKALFMYIADPLDP